MMTMPISERGPERPTMCAAIGAMLVLAAMVLVLEGCAVDEVHLVSYTSTAEVKPPENEPGAVVGSSPFPWDVVLRGISDILTGARKKAIEKRVGYRESRSFTLFRLKRAESRRDPCNKGGAQPGGQPCGRTGK